MCRECGRDLFEKVCGSLQFELSLALIADPRKGARRGWQPQSADSQQCHMINLFLRDSDLVGIPNRRVRGTFQRGANR
jgi:hypothetical protein